MVKPDDQSTRERILRAAGELIIEVGWSSVTTRLIAQRAGVNNALLHYYFGTKDDLLLEAASAAFTSDIAGPVEDIAHAGSVAEALKSAFSWLGTVDAHSPMMVITMEAAHQATRDERVAAWLRDVWGGAFDVFTSVITEGQRRGEIPNEIDPRGLAIAIGGLIDGLFLYRFVGFDFDVDKTTGAIGALIDALTKGQQ